MKKNNLSDKCFYANCDGDECTHNDEADNICEHNNTITNECSDCNEQELFDVSLKKNKRYSEFFTFVHFYKKDTKSQIKEFISEELKYNSEAQVTEDESGNSELLKYNIESDIIDWYYSDENGNEVKKENSITNGDEEYVEDMYRVYFSRVIISDYQGYEYYLEDWTKQNDYYIKEEK